MREILFRGKRMDNGEWIDGFYGVKIGDKHYIIIDKLAPAPCCDSYFVDCAVIPETVGQYTGLTDCVGKKIFEGDIFVDTDNQCVGVVEWCYGGFNINWYGKNGLMMEYGYDECAGEWGLLETEHCSDIYVDELEVVGNIHDNPELIKGDADA